MTRLRKWQWEIARLWYGWRWELSLLATTVTISYAVDGYWQAVGVVLLVSVLNEPRARRR